MKYLHYSALLLLLAYSCVKKADLQEPSVNPPTVASVRTLFTHYTIPQGQHYTNPRNFTPADTAALLFTVVFDSSAIYQTATANNQYDINKLYGFADNGAHHHRYSARFGWRWSDDNLRLFAYVYNDNVLNTQELGTFPIGKEIRCALKVANDKYLFIADTHQITMPRRSSTKKAKGYLLYPFFGGDETAPHTITIRLRNDAR